MPVPVTNNVPVLFTKVWYASEFQKIVAFNKKNRPYLQAVLWIWIPIGSVFRSLLDPDQDPYSEYGSGSTHVNTGLG